MASLLGEFLLGLFVGLWRALAEDGDEPPRDGGR